MVQKIRIHKQKTQKMAVGYVTVSRFIMFFNITIYIGYYVHVLCLSEAHTFNKYNVETSKITRIGLVHILT